MIFMLFYSHMSRRYSLVDNILLSTGADRYCPIIVLFRDDCILMGHRHYQFSQGQGPQSVWTMPGGRCRPRETVESALRREVYEETGIARFSISDLVAIVPGAHNQDVVIIFHGRTHEDFKLMEPKNFSEWKWFTRQNYIAGTMGVFNSQARSAILALISKHQ